MSLLLSVDELADQVNQWCHQHNVSPASGQAGERMTERNIRYYRTLGLLDPPQVGGGRGYGEKHLLQLKGVRLLQAQGLPLSRIRELLFGRTVEELRQIEERGLAEWGAARVTAFRPSPNESWGVTPLDDEFLIISRRGRTLSADLRERLLAALNGTSTEEQLAHGANERNNSE
jgi:DNA-binding transcriptional MerR regulator